MFQGEFSNNMDDKGRVSIPAAFRDSLSAYHDSPTVVITRSHNSPNLIAYPLREWKRLLQKIDSMGSSKQLLAYRRRVIGSAQEYTPDRQGRVLLSPALRGSVGLKRSVNFIGLGAVFEIWDSETWSSQIEADQELLQDFEL